MLDQFERDKRREMTELWKEHFYEHNEGFEMFTSELYEDAPALVIGFNPGGKLYGEEMTDRMVQFTSGDFSRPSQVEEEGKHYHPDYLPGYASSSNQPSRIKEYLFDGKTGLLRRTVETNRYYMRSDGKSEHGEFLQGLSSEPFAEYMQFCRETTRETIRRTSPDAVIDFANRHNGRATEVCADIGFDSSPVSYHTFEDNGSVGGSVSVAKMTEPPYSKVISVTPHLSYSISQPVLDMFAEVVPEHLPN